MMKQQQPRCSKQSLQVAVGLILLNALALSLYSSLDFCGAANHNSNGTNVATSTANAVAAASARMRSLGNVNGTSPNGVPTQPVTLLNQRGGMPYDVILNWTPTGTITHRKFWIQNDTYGGGMSYIRRVMTGSGWTETHRPTMEGVVWMFFARELMSDRGVPPMTPGLHVVNHVAGDAISTNDIALLEAIVRFQRKHGCDGTKWLPPTLRLDRKEDCVALLKVWSRSSDAQREQDMWFLKVSTSPRAKEVVPPSIHARSLGNIARAYFKGGLMRLTAPGLDGLETAEMEELCLDLKSKMSSDFQVLVQRNVPSPLLIQGQKFVITSYLLVASHKPMVAFYVPGIVRVALSSYDPLRNDDAIHVTSTHVQLALHKSTRSLGPDHIWMFNQRFRDYIAKKFGETVWDTVFRRNLKQLVAHVYSAIQRNLSRKPGMWTLVALDTVVDQQMQLKLVSISTKPRFEYSVETVGQEAANYWWRMWVESLNLVYEIHQKTFANRRTQFDTEPIRFDSLVNYELIHSEIGTADGAASAASETCFVQTPSA